MDRKTVKLLYFLLWTILLAGVSAIHSEASTITPSDRVASSVPIREKPTAKSTAIGKLERGKQIEYLGEVPNWYWVRLDAQRKGYVHKAWTRFVNAADAGPTSPGFIAPLSTTKKPLEIHFIDVGQGDSTLLVCPNGNRILIDAGSSAHGSRDDVRAYLLGVLDRGERTLTALVVTHPDLDHYNFLPDILRGVTVKQLLRTGDEEDFDDKFVSWLHTIPASRQQILYEKNYDKEDKPNPKLACGDAKIHILAAAIPTTRRGASNFIKNSLSTVLMVRYGTFRAILTGDATFDTEDAILKRYSSDWLQSDILKMGHHGSRSTSTSDEWATAVRPKIAIASAGYHSKHGHPSGEVVERLATFTVDHEAHPLTYAQGTSPYKWIEHEAYKEAIFSTSDSGNIVITTDGTKYDTRYVPFED